MGRFAVQRFFRSALTIWIVVTCVFVVLRLSGDPAEAMLGPDASAAAVEAFRDEHGLDGPLVSQYVAYLGEIATGDLGTSMQYDRPVSELFWQRLPATLELAGVALLIAFCLGVPAGMLAAFRRNSAWDRVTMLGAFVGQSAPNFFVGILLLLAFSYQLGWLPSSGRGSASHMVMPAVTLATGLLAALARMTRSSVLEVANADFVRTARAKGLVERRVLTVHILKNAALPILTISGMWIAGIIGGAAITETVFAWPGIGRLIVDAVSRRDYPVVQSVVLFVAISVVLANLIVDLLYGWLDPRVSLLATGDAR